MGVVQLGEANARARWRASKLVILHSILWSRISQLFLSCQLLLEYNLRRPWAILPLSSVLALCLGCILLPFEPHHIKLSLFRAVQRPYRCRASLGHAVSDLRVEVENVLFNKLIEMLVDEVVSFG